MKLLFSPRIHPDSRFLILWEIYILIITVSTTITTPLIVIFHITNSTFQSLSNVLVGLSFFVDIFIKLNIGTIEYHGMTPDRRFAIKKYLKGRFIWDLIAVLPTPGILIARIFSNSKYIFNCIRLLRLAKPINIMKTFNRAHKIHFLQPAFKRLLLLVFWMFIVAHLVTCGWISIDGPNRTLVTGYRNMETAVYIESFYWTITTLTTIGYGDITPKNEIQFIYVILVMFIGAGLYGFVIGNIANIIANMDIAKASFRKKVENIVTFLKYRNVPQELQMRITEYYDYLWESRRGYKESNLLLDLPISLKNQVSFFLNQELIEKVPIFKKASPKFIRDVILNLKPMIYTPNDIIVKYGEFGYKMYFINRGAVDVFNADQSIHYATLGSGQFFGEIALLLSIPRTATVKAQSYCDLYVLEKDTFDKILHNYPNFAKEVEKQAEINRQKLGLTKEDEYIDIDDEAHVNNSILLPNSPTSLSYQLLEDGVVKIMWNPVPNTENYEIVRKTIDDEKWKHLRRAIRTPGYIDLHAPLGESFYRVRGNNGHEKGTWSKSLRVENSGNVKIET